MTSCSPGRSAIANEDKRSNTVRPYAIVTASGGSLVHIPELDGLRGLAVLAVIFYHICLHWPFLPNRVRAVAAMGWMGVDLFFALSGFLITRILLRSDRGVLSLRNFYVKRALRIWPLYFCLLLVFCCELLFTKTPYPILRCLLFCQNYLPQFPSPHNFDQTWSLCVEEQFYLIWPILVFFLPRASLPWLLLSAMVGCPALRWAALERGVGDKLLYTASQYRLDSIAAGSLLAFLQPALVRQRLLPLRTLGVAVFTVSVPALIWLWLHSSRNLGNSSIYVFLALASGSAVCIAFASTDTRVGRILASGPLRYVGKISYGLYLIHPFVFSGVSKQIPDIGGLTGAVLLSFLLAAASWHFMERRFLERGALFLGPTPGLAEPGEGRA